MKNEFEVVFILDIKTNVLFNSKNGITFSPSIVGGYIAQFFDININILLQMSGNFKIHCIKSKKTGIRYTVDDEFRFYPCSMAAKHKIQEISFKDGLFYVQYNQSIVNCGIIIKLDHTMYKNYQLHSFL